MPTDLEVVNDPNGSEYHSLPCIHFHNRKSWADQESEVVTPQSWSRIDTLVHKSWLAPAVILSVDEEWNILELDGAIGIVSS